MHRTTVTPGGTCITPSSGGGNGAPVGLLGTTGGLNTSNNAVIPTPSASTSLTASPSATPFTPASAASPPAPASSAPPPFVQNRQLCDEEPGILALQQWLNANGYPLAQTGAGSPGKETDIFGPHTYEALIQFQAAHRLPATGFLGPLTRAALTNASTTAAAATTTATSTGQ